MNKNRPMLSRPLAARIRGAHNRLQEAISSKLEHDRRLAELQEKISSFEADPVGWSENIYPKQGVNSYPVQTHIARARESLARKLVRHDEVSQQLEEAKKNLGMIEVEVAQAAARLRASTPKEPWPEAPENLELQSVRFLAEIQEEENFFILQRDRIRRDAEREDEEYQAQCKREDEEARRRHISMGPEHVIIHQMRNRYIRKAHAEFRATEEYSDATDVGFSGGLMEFVLSGHAVKAGEEGVKAARDLIARSNASGKRLWDVCRDEGFWTPADL